MCGSFKTGVGILRRLLRYADKVFDLRDLIKGIGDTRQRRQIAMEWIFAAGLVMGLGQLGSLNALEQRQGSSYWRRWVGGKIGSADTIGYGFAHMEGGSIRVIIREVYGQLKRNKTLRSIRAGMIALVLDGHESHCSKKRCCDGCLKRRRKTKDVIAVLKDDRRDLMKDARGLFK